MLNKFGFFRDRKVLVTGADGFIGQHLVQKLLEQSARVSVLSRREGKPRLPVKKYMADLKDPFGVESCVLMADPEFIFHLAAQKTRSPKLADFENAIQENLMGSLHLFAAMKGLEGLESAVVVGTAEEYGNTSSPFREKEREAPVSSYSYSKLCITQLCQALYALQGMPLTVIRPSLAYGPGQPGDMFLPALIRSLAEDKPFAMSLGEQTRDYIYIDDLVEALLRAAQTQGLGGEIINVGSSIPLRISDLALKTEKMMAKKDMIRLGAISYRAGEIMDYFVDNTKARELLSWEPRVGIEEGLRRTIAYYLGEKTR